MNFQMSSMTGRLALVIGVVALVALLGAAAVWQRMALALDLAERTKAVRVTQFKQIAQLELEVTRVSLQLRHSMLARNPAERQAALDDIGQRRQEIDRLVTAYRDLLYTPAGKERFAPLPGLLQTFWQKGEANLAMVRGDRLDEAFAHLVDEVTPARNALLKVLRDTVDYQNEALAADIGRFNAATNAARWVLAGTMLVVLGALGGFALWFSSMLRQRISVAKNVAERVRDGDLTMPVAPTVQDEFAPLLQALSEMQSALQRVVTGVRRSADNVASASDELAHGNQDLSGRTEQQASALQLTTATMEQLGQTVRKNADSARQADGLAADAAEVAKQGGAVVRQVVTTMEGISESSRRISDIIGTIDGIAFQTNILALNAAVEAARAGEQGRGFAVVASEVRSLAQRSADAAREIKGLISASVERVEAGSALVHQAGTTMTGIVEAIDRVNAIVREISQSSQVQATGIDQVGQAIEQMDRSTQQNATLVEQSAAAADGMRQQAQQLVQAVAAFRVRETSV